MAANAQNTTLKATMLKYRTVGGSDSYTDLSGVLRGLTITQDEPESSSIDAEFFDSPFYIEYTGNPVTINFEWANYSLAELYALLGGSRVSATSETSESYSAPTSITSIEKEWRLDFGVGYKSLIIYRGALVATLKKDEDGALNYACTITSLNHNAGTEQIPNYRIYSIVGDTSSSSASLSFVTEPALPAESAGTSLTLTINRALTSTEKTNFSGTITYSTTSTGADATYTMASGAVKSGATNKGSYVIATNANSTIVNITLSDSVYLRDVSFDVTGG